MRVIGMAASMANFVPGKTRTTVIGNLANLDIGAAGHDRA